MQEAGMWHQPVIRGMGRTHSGLLFAGTIDDADDSAALEVTIVV